MLRLPFINNVNKRNIFLKIVRKKAILKDKMFLYTWVEVFMNIQSDYSYNYNVSMQGKWPKPKKPGDRPLSKFRKKIQQKILDAIPAKTFKDGADKIKKYDKYDGLMTRPDVNRLIMGVTAITTQPAIDYYNHRVDEETRTVSRNRTLAKIIACTSVGVLVRGSCYRLVNKMTNVMGKTKFNKSLLPKEYLNTLKGNAEKLTKYKSALSTIIALGVMTFTNFVLDAPLTVYFTNKFNEKSAKKKQRKEALNG